ncbi:MAG: hypothetical protein LBT30_07195 [Clostridiales bacterium]|jgi:hypothetical protein|nr:hypothetical protein [Clostridiales bacterium]
MKIIRTTVVELSTIPAIAYKQKLATGGAGLKIHRLDTQASASYTLDRRTAKAIAYGSIDTALFTDNAVAEALELTSGLPYSARGKVGQPQKPAAVQPDLADLAEAEEAVTENEIEKIDMVGSPVYNAIVTEYINAKGKLDYARLNKDYIQYASKSKVVAKLISDKSPLAYTVNYIVKNRAEQISKSSLTDNEIAGLIETLDEINTRSAFKELSEYIKHALGK